MATGDAGDDGIRMFYGPKELALTYMPKVDTRLGWTFVDSRHRCWEAVSVKMLGRAKSWPMSLLPGLLYDTQYRLIFDFAERPSISFDAIRSRLLAAIRANPRHYSQGYGSERRRELLSAQTVEELTKPDWLKTLEASTSAPLWSQ